ncbi:hypothetical protein KKZ80_14260 [Enterobacter kobei]|uniref:hypothetical protein n=1 Tax=Enterobacter kobei TaxID=208224 RepID=UPI001BE03E67|nr:hypothetical protein [Enterobacter kobei]MBT1907215.1 hypothetical protein [Enterobacter kobei]
MENVKFTLVYLFMVSFFLIPGTWVLFFDSTRLTSTDFLLVLIFFLTGVGLVLMGIKKVWSMLKRN